MNNKVLSNSKSVLFLGVGGVSVSQLALAYLKLGYKVYGYDMHFNETTEKLKLAGVEITKKFCKRFLNVEFCVRTAAIKDDNPYVVALKKEKTPVMDRAVVLGNLLNKFKCVIAVAGTHGKSTTCALIYEILRSAGKKVSCHIGADIWNLRFDFNDDYVVVEACEFNKSFLHIYPNVSVVTNVEPEHLDCYSSFKNLQNAFATFVKRGAERFVMAEQSTKFLTQYKHIQFVEENKYATKLQGEYNQKNISLAVAVCLSLGVEQKIIEMVVKNFTGIPRRYEYLGSVESTKIYIDYAHHPTEVKEFASSFMHEFKKSLIVFQPHTYSRTRMFFDEFVNIFANLNDVCVFKEYPAREQKSCGVDAKTLYKAVKLRNPNCKYMSTSKKLKNIINRYDAIAFVGAGDICKLARKIADSKREQ